MPPLALPTREHMEHARKLWEELKLPPLNLRAPWHGYTLGEWTEEWENFARRTTAGDWQQSGKETLARQHAMDADEVLRRRDVVVDERHPIGQCIGDTRGLRSDREVMEQQAASFGEAIGHVPR